MIEFDDKYKNWRIVNIIIDRNRDSELVGRIKMIVIKHPHKEIYRKIIAGECACEYGFPIISEIKKHEGHHDHKCFCGLDFIYKTNACPIHR